MGFFRRKRDDRSNETEPPDHADDVRGTGAPSGAVGFGYNTAWLAVRSDDPNAVAQALGLTTTREVSWSEGVDATSESPDDRAVVFVTPPVEGWTLAILGGSAFFEDAGPSSGRINLAALSTQFGEVQKFATHRVVEYHEWQRWVAGAPVRRYCWIGESGEIPFDEGEAGSAEGNLLRDVDGDWDGFDLADEETVMAVAAEWSVDPTSLDGREDLGTLGILGSLGYSPSASS